MSDREKIFRRIRNSAVIKNPLLFEAVGLCPVVAIAVSLRSAVYLAVITAMQMIVCEVLASGLLKNVRRYLRVALYFVFGIAIIYPIMYLTNRFIPFVSVNLGIYLPLMAVNSLVALHCERIAVKNTVKNSFVDAVSASLSYGAVTVVTGSFRELLGNGTICGFDIHLPVKVSALLLPFGGLIILGFASAVLKSFIVRRYPEESPDKSFDTSEIRRSLRGSFKDLMNDDFNPYGDSDAEVKQESAFDLARKNRDKKVKKLMKPVKKDNIKNRKQEAKIAESTAEKASRNAYVSEFTVILEELEEYKKTYEAQKNSETQNDGGEEE